MDIFVANSAAAVARLNNEMNALQPNNTEYLRRQMAVGLLYRTFRDDFGDQFVADVFYEATSRINGTVRVPEWVATMASNTGSPRWITKNKASGTA